jgi:hypothetical protein
MKTEPNSSAAPKEIAQTGEAVVAAYLAQELPKARLVLKRTRIICIVLISFIAIYIGTITTILVGFFQPQAAADVASGMLTQHAMRDGPILAAKLEWEIPKFIHQVPDYLIAELPVYRKELQQSLEAEYEAYCNSLSRDLGNQIDKLIDEHQAEIKTLLDNANDRDAIRKALPDFDRVIADCMNNDPEGRALREHLDEWASALKEVEKRMDRLANGTNLTPEEQKARYALALLSKVIEENTKMPEDAAATAKTAPATQPKKPEAKPKSKR